MGEIAFRKMQGISAAHYTFQMLTTHSRAQASTMFPMSRPWDTSGSTPQRVARLWVKGKRSFKHAGAELCKKAVAAWGTAGAFGATSAATWQAKEAHARVMISRLCASLRLDACVRNQMYEESLELLVALAARKRCSA